MPQKAQHDQHYAGLPGFLRELRLDAGLTQRDIGQLLGKPQSWVYNCETGNRRVDVVEFARWCEACGVKPQTGFLRFLKTANY